MKKRNKISSTRSKGQFFAVISGFQSILLFLLISALHSPLIANVQIFKLCLMAAKNATVGGDMNFRFRLLLRGAVKLGIFFNFHAR